MTAELRDSLAQVQELLGRATPGPWYSERGASRQQHVRGKSRNVNRAPARIATLGSPRAYQSDIEIEDEANARLIVAAVNLLKEHGPELMKMLEGKDGR